MVLILPPLCFLYYSLCILCFEILDEKLTEDTVLCPLEILDRKITKRHTTQCNQWVVVIYWQFPEDLKQMEKQSEMSSVSPTAQLAVVLGGAEKGQKLEPSEKGKCQGSTGPDCYLLDGVR